MCFVCDVFVKRETDEETRTLANWTGPLQLTEGDDDAAALLFFLFFLFFFLFFFIEADVLKPGTMFSTTTGTGLGGVGSGAVVIITTSSSSVGFPL